MEARKFKLQYFSRTARYLQSVKNIDTSAIETFISASLAAMTPNPTPITLSIFEPEIYKINKHIEPLAEIRCAYKNMY